MAKQDCSWTLVVKTYSGRPPELNEGDLCQIGREIAEGYLSGEIEAESNSGLPVERGEEIYNDKRKGTRNISNAR